VTERTTLPDSLSRALRLSSSDAPAYDVLVVAIDGIEIFLEERELLPYIE